MSNFPEILSQILSNSRYSFTDNDTINSLPEFLREYINNTISSIHVDIIDKHDIGKIIIYVDLPGVDPDNIDIDFYNNKLNIKGKRETKYTNADTLYMNNIKYGNFERSVMLPISVTNQESVSVRFNLGVLEITIDKETEERNRFSVRVQSNT